MPEKATSSGDSLPLIVWLHGSGERGCSEATFKARGLLIVVSEWKEIPTEFNAANGKFILQVDTTPIEGPEFYPTNMLGGPIPTVVGDPSYGTQVMGFIVVEFGIYNPDTSTYKWIYGVPVEVKFPYAVTTDASPVPGKTYYVYDTENNTFSVDTGAAAALTRYESIYS